MGSIVNNFMFRLYADFFMPSRLPLLRCFLRKALDCGFEFCSIAQFVSYSRSAQGIPDRVIALRHDVDTDVKTAGEFWRIEKDFGIQGSFFFRLATLDYRLMGEIHAGNSEASYHFEEIATYAKQMGVKTADILRGRMPEIRQMFAQNLQRLRRESGLPMTIVAAHGDFVNRRTGLSNELILADPAFRRAMQVEHEVYDQEIVRHFSERFSDAQPPVYWTPKDPARFIDDRQGIAQLLIHPRQWRADRLGNLRDDIGRLWEELGYRFR